MNDGNLFATITPIIHKCSTEERKDAIMYKKKKKDRSIDWFIDWLCIIQLIHAYAICCKRKDKYYGLRPSRVYIQSKKKGEPQSKDNTESGIVRHKFYIEEI